MDVKKESGAASKNIKKESEAASKNIKKESEAASKGIKRKADGCNTKSSTDRRHNDTQDLAASLSKNKESFKHEPVDEPPDLPPLPPEWKAYKSKKRPGKVYYFNEKTGKSEWKRPNTAREDKQRKMPNHPGSSQKRRAQKLVKIAKRSPEKLKIPTNPDEVIILFEKQPVKNLELPSAKVLCKTSPKSENQCASSLSTARKRQITLDTNDSSIKKPKSEEKVSVQSPSVIDMEVTFTASMTDNDNTNHGDFMNGGMTLSGWLDSHKDDAESESMDWETSSSAAPVILRAINHETAWHVVIDTNVLLENLDFVKHLRDCNYYGFGIVVVIPWVVLQELDHFKSNNSKKPHLQLPARIAISFIHCSLKIKHPRLTGQFCHARRNNVSNDDEILHHCLELQSRFKKVMLLTSDKNLCNKAVISKVECQTVPSLSQWLSLETPFCPEDESTQNQICDIEMAPEASPFNEIVKSAKSIMVTFFGYVLTKEMQSKFGDMWLRIVLKKPPWNFKDLMLCLEKHWIAVMSEALSRPAETIIKSILKSTVLSNHNSGQAMKNDEVSKALDLCKTLCHNIKCPDYNSRRDATVKELMALQQRLVTLPSQSSPESQPDSIKDKLPEAAKDTKFLIPEDLEKVISCFNNLWNSVFAFCSDVRSMLQRPDHILVNKIDPKIMTYYRFLNSFLKVNERLIATLVMAGSECNISDLTEMRNLLLQSPCNEGIVTNTSSFPLLALKNFYINKRDEMLLAKEKLNQAMELILTGLNFLGKHT